MQTINFTDIPTDIRRTIMVKRFRLMMTDKQRTTRALFRLMASQRTYMRSLEKESYAYSSMVKQMYNLLGQTKGVGTIIFNRLYKAYEEYKETRDIPNDTQTRVEKCNVKRRRDEYLKCLFPDMTIND